MPTTVIPQQQQQKPEINQEEQDKVILKTAASEVFDIERHVIQCSAKFDKLTMEVNVQKEKHEVAHQRCFILTVHNLGFDSKYNNRIIESTFGQMFKKAAFVIFFVLFKTLNSRSLLIRNKCLAFVCALCGCM